MTIGKFVEEYIFKPANRNQAAIISVDLLLQLYFERVCGRTPDYWRDRRELERKLELKGIRRCGKYRYKVDEGAILSLL